MPQHTAKSPASMVLDIAGAFARLASIPKVYPAYIASRVKAALLLDDPRAPRPNEHIIEAVGDAVTLGSSRYAMEVTDHNGTKYKITVEVLR